MSNIWVGLIFRSLDYDIEFISRFFYLFDHFFLTVDLIVGFLISAVITQILNPIAELSIPIGILTNKAR